MAFRHVQELVLAGSGDIGSNWISLPFVNPYTTIADFCAKTGLPSSGVLRASILMIDPNTGLPNTQLCGTPGAAATSLIPGRGIRVRVPNAAGARTKIVIAGSHDPNLPINVPRAGSGNIGTFWYSVPYHTTAGTVRALCDQIGLTRRDSISVIIPATGQEITTTCGPPGGINPQLILILVRGQAVKIRSSASAVSFVPMHF